jgi:TfoX/Sxy family transcriptional regulator of competence genes
MNYDPEVAERIRRLLSGRDDVAEKKMVGGLSFLVSGNMCCGVTGPALMVRVGRDARPQALQQPHVRPMQFAGRDLSAFVCVDPPGFAADDALAQWVQRGLDFAANLPVKPTRPASNGPEWLSCVISHLIGGFSAHNQGSPGLRG